MSASHEPKLVLITAARLLLTMYCADRSTPSVVNVDFEITNLIVAFFATAPDHSTSRSASTSSSLLHVAGIGAVDDHLRRIGGQRHQAAERRPVGAGGCVRPTMAMVWPAAVDARGVERIDVVDRREIARRRGNGSPTRRCSRARAFPCGTRPCAGVHRLAREVVQADHAGDDIGQRPRNRRILGVRVTDRAVGQVVANLRTERVLRRETRRPRS